MARATKGAGFGLAPLLVLVLVLGLARAWAGGADIRDEKDLVPYFGFVRDGGGNAVADAKVTAEFKTSGVKLITRTDATGAYTIYGLRKDTDPKTVEITCAKDGFRYDKNERRDPDVKPGQPVETDCFLAKP